MFADTAPAAPDLDVTPSGERAPPLESVIALRFSSRRRVAAARARAEAEGRPPLRILLDSGALDLDEIVVAARHGWARRVSLDAAGALPRAGAAADAHARVFGFRPTARASALKLRLSRATRAAGACLGVASGLLALDIALTVYWQEPLSALMTSRAQARLDHDLDRLRADWRRPLPDRRRLQAAAVARLDREVGKGEPLGRIEVPRIGVRFVIVEGTDASSLRKGPGHFEDTALPGQGRTVAIAGHRTTYRAPFRRIDELRRGDRIVLDMPYGRFQYAVERSKVVDPGDYWVTRRVGHERLVLTACHPLYSNAQRIVVFARRGGRSAVAEVGV